jgi:hypothetical protein
MIRYARLTFNQHTSDWHRRSLALYPISAFAQRAPTLFFPCIIRRSRSAAICENGKRSKGKMGASPQFVGNGTVKSPFACQGIAATLTLNAAVYHCGKHGRHSDDRRCHNISNRILGDRCGTF